jgi:hypothetical protein
MLHNRVIVKAELSSEIICTRTWYKIMTSMEDIIIRTNFMRLLPVCN